MNHNQGTLIGIASDHGGFELKQYLSARLKSAGYELQDFGNKTLDLNDDYPDYVLPLARAISEKKIKRGIAICGSGVGATVAANKVHGVRACLIFESFSAHQGVEDDDLNLICLGGRVLGTVYAWEILQAFLASSFSGAERHRRRLDKVNRIDKV
jgi:ribose 5-phosphate isomerase B